VAIDGNCQGQGLGTELIGYTLDLADRCGIPLIFVIGDENYYSRFGFESASKYNLYLEGTSLDDENPFFMVRIFNDASLDGNLGIFHNPDVFDVDESDVDEFDKDFEYREKLILDGQLVFE
jgi:predicted N-acetyltransferase YhbS